MSRANDRDNAFTFIDGVRTESKYRQWPATVDGNIESGVLQMTTPAVVDGDGEIITPAVWEMIIVDGPRLLNVKELERWDVAETKDSIVAAKTRALRNIDWANDKAAILNTKADESEALARPIDNATALTYIQFLYDYTPIWMRYDAKVYQAIADSLFGTGEASTQDPI